MHSTASEQAQAIRIMGFRSFGAGDGIRTRDINLGKVALYQLSYSRACGGKDLRTAFIVALGLGESQTHVARPVRSYSTMACITACSKSRCNSGIEVWTIRIATIF